MSCLNLPDETDRSEGLSRLPYRDKVLWVIVIIAGLMLAFLSTRRYMGYNVGMHDIGNMAQAMWSTSEGRPLEFSYHEGLLSRMALHVEVCYFILAPLYWLFPTPATLLIFQAFLFAMGAFPVYRLAERRLGSVFAARIMALMYLIYPVALSSVLFDFHGDTLAMPILCYVIEAADRRSWGSYYIWLAFALGCKFYVSISTAVFGFLLIFDERKRAGYITVMASALWLLVATLLIRPYFAPQTDTVAQSTLTGYMTFYFGRISNIGEFQPGDRLLTLIIIFAPAIIIGRFYLRWLLPAAAIAFPALLAVGEVSAFSYLFHHYALTVPFGVLAIIRGAEWLKNNENADLSDTRKVKKWKTALTFNLAVTTILSMLLINIPINPLFWLAFPGWGFDELAYGRTSRDSFKDRWLAKNVAPDARVITSMTIAPHLVNRRTVFLFEYPCSSVFERLERRLEQIDFAIADALFDYATPVKAGSRLNGGHPIAVSGGVLSDIPAIAILLQRNDFGLVESRDGMLLFKAGVEKGDSLKNRISTTHIETMQKPLHSFGNVIDLVESDYNLSGNRLQLVFKWKLSENAVKAPEMFAVTRIEGIEHSRLVHLPTMALHPVSEWGKDNIVSEYFEVFLPGGIENGTYRLLTGWHVADRPYSWVTDHRSLLGEETTVGFLTIENRKQ